MPAPRGNMPISSGSNHNQAKAAKPQPPKRNKKAPVQRRVSKESSKVLLDNKQSRMINQLSKQVYKLQMGAFGSVQQNLHSLDKPLVPTRDYPICLDLTDFTCVRPTGPPPAVPNYGAPSFQAQLLPPYWGRVASWARNAVIADNYYWKDKIKTSLTQANISP